MPSTLHEHARAYAQAGRAVFPLRPRDKRPLVNRGFYAATTDLATIDQWWTRAPEANIGCPTGAINGIWVLDVDDRAGRETLAILEEEHAPLPETITQATGGGGVQYLWAWPTESR